MSGKSGYSDGVLRYPVSVVDHKKTLIDPQLEEIQEVIPADASPDNMLATDDNVATSSATFRGTSESGLTEQQFLAWADSLEKDKNDYCYWLTTEDGKTIYKRYKYNGTEWAFEYNVADPSSIPTALSQLTDDATHRLVTDTEKTTWNGKAEVGTSQDTPSEDTIYGAKAYAASLSLISVVALTSDVTSECSITGASNSGRQQTIVYTNSSGSDKTVTVPVTNYSTPDGQDIELSCPDGGYCEVSYLNVEGVIFARGV